ncbi:MAG: CDGSH iron-sulfur domain-containing protein [Acidobacteria bacterium]|nr:CDGSH iron-sulfur domain-containing protein [Acidobacteriota bacterium]
MKQPRPCQIEVIKGKKYAWCTCGRSEGQPLCDGSHRGTDMLPMLFEATADETVTLCGCKKTGDQPYCDGSHSRL